LPALPSPFAVAGESVWLKLKAFQTLFPLNPAPDEVLYEPLYDNVPVRTAFPDGREIGFPYITKVGEEIEFLNAFAELCSLLKVTKG